MQEWVNRRLGVAEAIFHMWHVADIAVCQPNIFPFSLSTEHSFYLGLLCVSERTHFPKTLASKENEAEDRVTQFGSMSCAEHI